MPRPGPAPEPSPKPTPPQQLLPIPPFLPGPLDAPPNLDHGSPICATSTFGSFSSGGPSKAGSIVNFALGFGTTHTGGTNGVCENFRGRRWAAGMGERSPPLPPARASIVVCFGASSGGSTGAVRVTWGCTWRTTGVTAAAKIAAITADCKLTDITHDFFCRPYWPQMSRTSTGFEVTSSSGGAGWNTSRTA